ncbi:MAG: hypothetical protein M5U08_25570 [Burkholderiales bacterium]|nr:hypothetical protein [Burkholderiales bacterium]
MSCTISFACSSSRWSISRDIISTSTACARGTTTTPSTSPTMMSPGRTSMPPQVTGMFAPSVLKRPSVVPGETERAITGKS